MAYWNVNKKYQEFTGTERIQEKYDEIFRELIRQKTVVKAYYEELIWINPTHLVPKSNGEMRLVVDTTKENFFMMKIHFKMEGVPTLVELLQKNDYAISFDLKEAYKHVPVHLRMQPLLGVCWQGQCYKYVGTPFGLNDFP
jgi:hypothetical protein